MRRAHVLAVAVLVVGTAALAAFTTAAVADGHEIDTCTVVDEPGHYELTDDIHTDREGTCIDVRSSDVVLDGNGHAIHGPGPENVSEDGRSIGVYVNESEDTYGNVTVRNAEVTGFATGVQTGPRGFGGPDATLEDVLVRQNGYGIQHYGSQLNLTNVTSAANDERGLGASYAAAVDGTDVTVRDNGAGISGLESGVTLESSRVADNDDYGVTMGPHARLTLTDVEVSGNADHGVVMTSMGSNLTMAGGSVTQNGGPGVTVRAHAEGSLVDVTVAGNGEDGVRALSATVTLENVTAVDNADLELNGADGNVTASGFHVGTAATTRFDAEAVGLEPVDRDALPPREDGTAAGDGLNVSGTVDGPLELVLEVDTDDETVDLWRHDRSDWETVEEGLDAGDGTVEASVDRNGTYAPGTDDEQAESDDGEETDDPDSEDGTDEPDETGDDGTDDSDASQDGDETGEPDDADGSKDAGDSGESTPSDEDGEKTGDPSTPTSSDQDGDEKEKDGGTPTSAGASDCGCPSSDGDADAAAATATDSPTSTASGAATPSPASDEQRAGDEDGAATNEDAVAETDDDTLGDGAGPGPLVAVLAVLGAVLLVHRRA